MSVALIVGTAKGAAVLTSGDRNQWSEEFVLQGWPVTASVRDGGKGLPQGVELKNGGLGMTIVDAFVEQSRSMLDVKRLRNGTEFVLRIPLQ